MADRIKNIANTVGTTLSKASLSPMDMTSVVKLSLYFSVWMISCILLYTYNHKHVANIEYNKLMTKMNTRKLKDQIKHFKNKATAYHTLAYPTEVMDARNEAAITGLAQAKKDVYTELIKTIELYDKCNLLRSTSKGSTIPWTEIMISIGLIIIVVTIIVVFNHTNSPLVINDKVNEIEEIKETIKNVFDEVQTDTDIKELSSKKLDSKYVEKLDNKFKNIVQTGGESSNDVDSEMYNTYNKLLRANMMVSQKVTALESSESFNYSVVAVSIVLLTVYLSIKMYGNAMSFTNNLYSGSLFMNSRCYNL